MLDTYRRILRLLSRREKTRFVILIGLFFLAGVIQVIGVASVLPFLAVLANPSVIETNAVLSAVHRAAGAPDLITFQLMLGGALLGFNLFSIVARWGTTVAQTRFAQNRIHSLSTRMLDAYLSQPYVWFLRRNSSDMAKTVLGEVNQIVSGSIAPSMKLISQSMVVALTVALLVAVDPVVAIISSVIVGVAYVAVSAALRARVRRMSKERLVMNKRRFRAAHEAFGGVKEIKVQDLEPLYVRRYGAAARRMAQIAIRANAINIAPKHLLEAIVFTGLTVMLMALLVRNGGDVRGVLPTIGLYAVAGARLFPAVQGVFGAFMALRMGQAVLENVLEDFETLQATALRRGAPAKPLGLREGIAARGLRFAFPNASTDVLRGIDIDIRARTTVGFVGGTGAGKTTLVDVLMGLIEPSAGQLCVDGAPITPDSVAAWRRSVGYVPQHIYLLDDSVAANIAFGVPKDEIDMAAVERAARTASLHDFVTSELPEGYDTLVGDRGARLSGGQRQRVGIARALYLDPDVLILDEATSALDNLTEHAVIASLRTLHHEKTVIMIAHRLSTLRGCDTIFFMERGQITAQGSYDELLERSAAFRDLDDAPNRIAS